MSSDELDALRAELAAERKRAREFSDFIGSLMHEYRARLSSIATNLYLMRRNPRPDDQPVYRQRIEREHKRLLRLDEDLMVMVHLSQQAYLTFESTELNAFLKSRIEDYEATTSKKQIKIELISDRNPCFVQIDFYSFATAITKLLENAVSYTPELGRITSRLRVEDKQTVCVKDLQQLWSKD